MNPEKYNPVVDSTEEISLEPAVRPAPAPAPTPAARPNARKILIAAAAVLLLAGVGLWFYLQTYESTDDAQIDGHINPISARISGYITQVDVDDNQYVEKSQVLVRIDPKDYQVAVDRARAELADATATANAEGQNVPITTVSSESSISTAEAEVENAHAGVAAAEKQLAAAQAELAQAQANNTKAQDDVVRYAQLISKQEISQQQYDQAVTTAEASEAAVEAARASAAAATHQVTQAHARLAQSQANLRSAQTAPHQIASSRDRAAAAQASAMQKKAQLEQAELNLQYCTIVAPVSGVVSKNVEVGMYVSPGQQLLSIVPLDDVWVTANFKETQLRHIRPGQRVKISVDAFGRDYKGRVDSIAGASGARFSLLPPENATGNYVKVVQRIPVKIVLDPGENKDHRLRPGMSVVPKAYVR